MMTSAVRGSGGKQGSGRGGPLGNHQASRAAGGHGAERPGGAAIGGLETGTVPSPFQIIAERTDVPVAAYFPPDSRQGQAGAASGVDGAPDDDVCRYVGRPSRDGAVGILHGGIDPWVIDFGSPDKVEGGMQRNLADHVVALTKPSTPSRRHRARRPPGGLFAGRHVRLPDGGLPPSKDLASIVGFGSPVDTLAALPMVPPSGCRGRRLHGRSRVQPIDIPGWMARTGFQMLDPIKTAKARIDFCVSFTTAKPCCRANNNAGSSILRDGSPGRGRRFPNCSSGSSPTTG